MIIQIGHDYFDIPDRTDYFDTEKSIDGNTSMCYEGKHPRSVETVNFQVVILVDQFDTMISSDGNFSDKQWKRTGTFSSRDVRFFRR